MGKLFVKPHHRWLWVIAPVLLILAAVGVGLAAPGQQLTSTPPPVGGGHVATAAELRTAQAQWATTRHANTYDNGLGANTTCASCKSPRNWDPNSSAVEAAQDCTSCKREPGKPRPELEGGVPVPKNDWKSITCDVCHQPVGDSYNTAISFWNQAVGGYEPMTSSTALCEKCHEGRHGFDVVWEQANSPAHKDWACTRCHGAHGTPVKCTDCHNVEQGRGAQAHAQHPNVNCTACHDAGGLGIWQDPNPDSRRFGQIAPQRFGHALRSWPSHNLQTATDCRRCHHPRGAVLPVLPPPGSPVLDPVIQPAIASQVGCAEPACHPNGAVFEWCPVFPRDTALEVKRP